MAYQTSKVEITNDWTKIASGVSLVQFRGVSELILGSDTQPSDSDFGFIYKLYERHTNSDENITLWGRSLEDNLNVSVIVTKDV